MLTLAHLAHSFAFDDARRGNAEHRQTDDRLFAPCNAKIIDCRVRTEVPVNELPAGWQERAHVLMNQMYCQGPMRAAIDNEWTVAFTIMSARESY
jgi:hypothetical protein